MRELKKSVVNMLNDNYTDKEQGEMCLMDWEAREWDV